MALTDRQLREVAGLNTDGVEGFRAQMRSRLPVLEPAHYVGARIDNFRRGAELARCFQQERRAMAGARRSFRARDFREQGHTDTLRPAGQALRDEQLQALQSCARRVPA